MNVLWISEEELVEEEMEQQNFQPAAKVGAKKQKKLDEKQARKAQREVNKSYCTATLLARLTGNTVVQVFQRLMLIKSIRLANIKHMSDSF